MNSINSNKILQTRLLQFVLIGALWLGSVPLWSQIPVQRSASKTKHIEIPFEVINNFIILTFQVNGANNFKFIFDTGSEHSLFFELTIAQALQFNFTRQIEIYGSDMTRSMNAFIANGIDFETSNLNRIKTDILVLEENIFSLDEYFGFNIAGIIGNSMFRGKILEIDYDFKVLRVYNNHEFRPTKRQFQELPTQWIKGKPYVITEIFHEQNHESQKLLLLFDTGASISMILYLNAMDSNFIPDITVPGTMGLGLGGEIFGLIGRVDRIKLGSYELEKVITYFQSIDSTLLQIDQSNKMGIIGNALISHFNVRIDYTSNRVYLSKHKATYKPMQFDRSGIFVVTGGLQLNEYYVRDLMVSSPGDVAGLQKGDKILSISGIPYQLLSLNKIHKVLSSKKRNKVKFKIQRGDQKIRYTVFLRDII